MPGNESDGNVVMALGYVVPRLESKASHELGLSATYWARSEACSPSTLISRVWRPAIGVPYACVVTLLDSRVTRVDGVLAEPVPSTPAAATPPRATAPAAMTAVLGKRRIMKVL